MQIASHRMASPAKTGAKWLLLGLAFVWLVGCAGLTNKNKMARDPFADPKFSCGEDKPGSATSASLPRKSDRT